MFSKSEATKVALVDAKLVSTVEAEYVSNNSDAYYLLLNTWSLLLERLNRDAMVAFRKWLFQEGLLYLIKCFSNASDTLMGISDEGISTIVHPFLEGVDDKEERLRECLQILRYPKRFSPLCADLIEKESISKFIEIDNLNKLKDRGDSIPPIILADARAVLRTILKSYSVSDDLFFSNGVAINSSSDLPSKVASLLSADPMMFWPYQFSVYQDSKNWSQDASVAIKAVPKSYKAARLIAPENNSRQLQSQRRRDALEKCALKSRYAKYINTRSQDFQRQRALEGSISGELATFDLSSASDTVRKTLIMELFPKPIADDLLAWAPRMYTTPYKRERRTLYMFATAGNSMTFIVETLVFFSIAYAVTKLYERFAHEKLSIPSVFGDDIIVDSRISELFPEVMQKCGFIVNLDKSFASRNFLYRESCGVEYYKGMSMSSNYFPRKPIVNLPRKGDKSPWTNSQAYSLSSVIQLEHRLYFDEQAREFLCSFVRGVIPSMTSHLPQNECSDLWEWPCKFGLASAPGAKRLNCDRSIKYRDPLTIDDFGIREVHYSLSESVDTDLPITKGKYIFFLEPKKCITMHPNSVDWELFQYIRFLDKGPSYEDALLRCLKVSQACPSFLSIGCEKKAHWVRTQE